MICKSSAAPHAAADWLSCFTGIIRTWPSVARMTPRWKLQCQKKKNTHRPDVYRHRRCDLIELNSCAGEMPLSSFHGCLSDLIVQLLAES